MMMQLPADIADKVQKLVEAGRYETVVDVLRAALGALELRDEEAKFLRLKALVLEGFASGDAGELTPEMMDEIDREVDEAFARGDRPSQHVCPQAPRLEERSKEGFPSHIALHQRAVG